jgi:hypothetical protein
MNSMRGRAWRGLLVLLLAASGLDAQQVSYSGSFSYSGGSYIFDTRSDTWVLSSGLRLRAGPVSVSASAPFLIRNGGLITTIAGGVALPTGGSESGAVARRGSGETIGTRGSGRGSQEPTTEPVDTVAFASDFSADFGDPVVTVEGELLSGFGTVRSLSVSVGAKAPLADVAGGLSSGEWDVGLGGSAVLGLGRVLVLADASYWWIGDMPELELRDGLSYAVGVSTPVFSGRGSLMGMVSGLSKMIETMEPPVTVSASLGRSVGDRSLVSATAGFGLTESAADLYFAVGWSIRLGPGTG